VSTKDELVKLMLDEGMSATDANTVADLSEHASLEAIQTISRVCDLAPQGLRAATMLTAVRILVASLGAFEEEASAVMASRGKDTHEVMVIQFFQEVYQHYKTPMDAVGVIPELFSQHDPRPVREQIAGNYIGGWRPMSGGTMDPDTRVYSYPGDPPMKPLALMVVRDETVVVYDSGVTAIFQSDGSYELSRLS